MCSFLSNGGKHLVLLAISGVEDVMSMFLSDKDGNVILRVCGEILVLPLSIFINKFRSAMMAQRNESREFWLAWEIILKVQMQP